VKTNVSRTDVTLCTVDGLLTAALYVLLDMYGHRATRHGWC